MVYLSVLWFKRKNTTQLLSIRSHTASPKGRSMRGFRYGFFFGIPG